MYGKYQALLQQIKEPAADNEKLWQQASNARMHIIVYAQKINEAIAEISSKTDRIITELESIENNSYHDILVMRYVLGEEYKQISETLHYNRRWVCTLHDRALIDFYDKVLNPE